MTTVFRVAVFISALAVSTSCSRKNGGSSAADTAVGPTSTATNSTATNSTTKSATTKSSSRPAGVAATSAPPTTSARPHLTKLTPSSGSVASGQIITVEVTGDGLMPVGNTTFFGSINLGDLASPDGRTIRFAVPQTVPSRGEVPPMAMQPGTYAVYVMNSRGASDTLRFTIRDQP